MFNFIDQYMVQAWFKSPPPPPSISTLQLGGEIHTQGTRVIISRINIEAQVSEVSAGHRVPSLNAFITLTQDEQSGKTEEMKFLAAPKSPEGLKKQMDLSLEAEIVLQ